MKTLAQQIFLAHRAIYYPQLLKTSLLSETIVSQAQPAFFLFEFSNNNCRIKSKICSAVFTVNFEYILTCFSIFADFE